MAGVGTNQSAENWISEWKKKWIEDRLEKKKMKIIIHKIRYFRLCLPGENINQTGQFKKKDKKKGSFLEEKR